MSELDIVVETNGHVRTIYSEQLDLRSLGQPSIRRGSHVEPTAEGMWTADLRPVDGPMLGPFPHRSRAIAAEIAWLRRYWLTVPDRQLRAGG